MGISVDDKIKMVLEECKGIWAFDVENKFKYLYPFTTENLAGYMNEFDLKGKSMLTVGSSCDQTLNAIFQECKDISVVDLCPFAKEYYYLKKAAIQVFNREEFLNFFCLYYFHKVFSNNKAFSNREYEKLRDALKSYDEETLYFWDTLFQRHRGLKIRKRLFNFDEISVDYVKKFNTYLISDNNYYALRNNIENANVSFENVNLFDYKSDKLFDFINLSNVIDYNSFSNFKNLIDKMIGYLNDDGELMFAYMYYVDETLAERVLNEFNKIIPEGTISFVFPAVNNVKKYNCDKDMIYTYKKVKKM